MPLAFWCVRGVRVFAVVAVLVSLAVMADPPAQAAVAAAGARSARAAGPLTVGQALARAASSGRAVPVPGATTATQTLTANPDGTLTLRQSIAPPTAGSSANEWTTVKKAFPGKSYWETPGLLQVGYQAQNFPHFVAPSFVSMPVPPQIFGG